MSEANLNRIDATVRSSDEHLILPGGASGPTLGEFWSWSMSDLVSNATRGVLAEFIVATALGINSGVREEWAAWDLTWGSTKIEVKSAAYVQAWHQQDYSKVSFNVGKSRSWDADSNKQAKMATRDADVYVLALLHQKTGTVEPLDTDQWTFWAIPTHVLDERTRSQHSITAPTLEKSFQQYRTGFSGLKLKIEQAGRAQAGTPSAQ